MSSNNTKGLRYLNAKSFQRYFYHTIKLGEPKLLFVSMFVKCWTNVWLLAAGLLSMYKLLLPTGIKALVAAWITKIPFLFLIFWFFFVVYGPPSQKVPHGWSGGSSKKYLFNKKGKSRLKVKSYVDWNLYNC